MARSMPERISRCAGRVYRVSGLATLAMRMPSAAPTGAYAEVSLDMWRCGRTWPYTIPTRRIKQLDILMAEIHFQSRTSSESTVLFVHGVALPQLGRGCGFRGAVYAGRY